MDNTPSGNATPTKPQTAPSGTEAAGIGASDGSHSRHAALTQAVQLHSVIAFDTGLTHRLRQPLTAIFYLCGIVRNIVQNHGEPALNAELAPYLDKIEAQVSRATEILSEVREQTRAAAQPRGAFRVAAVLADVLALLEPLAAEQAVKLAWQVEEGLPEVPGDAEQIRQGLFNLILNGIEALAMDRACDRCVSVTGTRTQDGVLLSVTDNGPGIEPTRGERIFELFETTKPGRLGFGLGISRSIARAHDGRLWHEDNPDGGAIFRLLLPLAEGNG